MPRRVSPGAFAEGMKRIKRDLRAGLRRGVLSGAKRCLPILHQATRTAIPANPGQVGSGGAFNTGAYLRAWRAEPISGGARVYNDSVYAAVIEHGRRRGKFPPIAAIQLWAQRKFRLKVKSFAPARTARLRAAKARRSSKSVSQSQLRNIAFVIARAIARRGLRARRVMHGVRPAMRAAVVDEIKREMAEALRTS